MPDCTLTNNQSTQINTISVLSEPALLTLELLGLETEELAELLRGEHVDPLSLSLEASATPSARLQLLRLSLFPDDEVGSDDTAGDAGPCRAILLGVPRAAEAIVVRVLVNSHRLVEDARLADRGPEAGLLRRLEVPAVGAEREAAPEVTDVVRRVVAVPAVRLPGQLVVAASRAAVPAVPRPLVDGQRVASAWVGQVVHPAPDPDRRCRRGLPQVIVAVRVGRRIAWVSLHFAIGAPGGTSQCHAPLEICTHLFVILDELIDLVVAAS